MKEVSIDVAYRLIGNGPTIMISSQDGDFKNVMSNAWNCPVDLAPSKLLVVIASTATTRKIIEKTGEFIINVPTVLQKDLVVQVGSCHGCDGDKFAKFNIASFDGVKVKAPCLADCLAWLECKVIPEPEMTKKYDIIFAEVVYARVQDDYFDGEKLCVKDDVHTTLHYTSNGEFGKMVKL